MKEVIGVIIGQEADDLVKEVRRVLEPFRTGLTPLGAEQQSGSAEARWIEDGSKADETYEDAYRCVGAQASGEVGVRTDKELGELVTDEDYMELDCERDLYLGCCSNPPMAELWCEGTSSDPWYKKRHELLTEHPLKHVPDKACLHCKGTGREVKARRDVYEWLLGGRFAGMCTSDGRYARPLPIHFPTGRRKGDLEESGLEVVKCSQLVKRPDVFPGVILSADGRWYEMRGPRDWLDPRNHKNEKNWKKRVMNILERNADSWVMACRVLRCCPAKAGQKEVAQSRSVSDQW